MSNSSLGIIFYVDTDHNKSLFFAIYEHFKNSIIVDKRILLKVKRERFNNSIIINELEENYAEFIRAKYNSDKLSIKCIIKSWQRLGLSRYSLQRKYRKYKIRKEFEKWVTFFKKTDLQFVAAWCPIKPKREIIFKAALHCNKHLLYFEDAPIPGYITCDYKGVNAGISLKRDINFYKKYYNDNALEDLNFDRLFSNIIQRKSKFQDNNKNTNYVHDPKRKMLYCPLQVQDDTQIIKYGSWIRTINQFIDAVYIASRFLPTEWRLVIREHPSSTNSYYDKIISLSDDRFLIDNSTDSIDLINQCDAILTINSSVGFHGLLNGKPVIICGEAFWGFKPISYTVRSNDELVNKLININSIKADLDAIKYYLNYLFRVAFIPVENNGVNFTINRNDVESLKNKFRESELHYDNFYQIQII